MNDDLSPSDCYWLLVEGCWLLVVGCAQGLLELVLKGDYALELPEKPCKCARGKATGNRGDRIQTGVSYGDMC